MSLMVKKPAEGFTLLEVLIAMAITAFVALIATTSLSRVLDGVESLRASADRTYEVNRAWMIILLLYITPIPRNPTTTPLPPSSCKKKNHS
mgnify:CR=1 FL=1